MISLIRFIKMHGYQAYPAPNETNKIEIVKQLDDGSQLILRLHASFKAVMPWLGY
jgi:hypothetical protein